MHKGLYLICEKKKEVPVPATFHPAKTVSGVSRIAFITEQTTAPFSSQYNDIQKKKNQHQTQLVKCTLGLPHSITKHSHIVIVITQGLLKCTEKRLCLSLQKKNIDNIFSDHISGSILSLCVYSA